MLQTRAEEDRYYRDINKWWRREGTCADPGWRLLEESRGSD